MTTSSPSVVTVMTGGVLSPPIFAVNIRIFAASKRKRGSRMTRMNTAKDEVRRLLDGLPDEASFEDIQYQVYLLDEVSRGSREIDRGEG